MTKQKIKSRALRGLLLAVVAWMLFPSHAKSEEQVDCLSILMHNGERVTYVLDEKPALSFDDNLLIIESGNVRDEYVLSDIAKFNFDKTSSLSDLLDSKVITFSHGQLSFSGFVSGTAYTLFDLGGRSVYAGSVGKDGTASVVTDAFTPGIYVVRVDGWKSFKIKI